MSGANSLGISFTQVGAEDSPTKDGMNQVEEARPSGSHGKKFPSRNERWITLCREIEEFRMVMGGPV